MSLANLGNGIGLLYVTNATGGNIETYANIPSVVSAYLSRALVSAPLGGEVLATTTFTFASSGSGNIQVSSNAYGIIGTGLWAGTLATTVNATATAINANAGNYSAVSDGVNTITITAPPGTGSSGNNIILTASANGGVTVTSTNPIQMSGGSNTGGVYSTEVYGKRFYIYADLGAVVGTISGATEITNLVVPRSLSSQLLTTSGTISSGVVATTIRSLLSQLLVDTQGASASDDLDTLTSTNITDLNVVIIRGVSSARVVTVKNNTGNILLANSVDFVTGDYTSALALQYSANLNQWVELWRTPGINFSVSVQRSAGFPTPVSGVTDVAMPVSGTLTLTPGTSKQYQRITGSPVMAAGYNITSGGTPIDGDTFYIIYQATPTVGSNTVTIFGKALTSTQAAGGKITVRAVYDSTSTSYQTTVLQDTFNIDLVTSTQLATKQNSLGQPAADDYILYNTVLGTPYWGPAPGSTTYVASVTLSSAQVLALNGTPIEMVPAPGTGFVIQPIGHLFGQRVYGTTQYTTATAFGVRYVGSGSNVYQTTASMVTSSGNKLECSNFSSTTSFTPIDGVAMEIYAATANPLAGDSTYLFTFLYRIVTLN